MTIFSLTEVCHAVMREGITAYIEHTGSGVMTLYAGRKVNDFWTVAAGPGRVGVYHSDGPGEDHLAPVGPMVGNTMTFSVGPGNMQAWVAEHEKVWICPESATVAQIADEIIRQVREHDVQTPVATPPKTWPDTDAERQAFVDWQYEVGQGDTLHGFRDYLPEWMERNQ